MCVFVRVFCVFALLSIIATESYLPSCAPNFPCDLIHSSQKMTVGLCECVRLCVCGYHL